MIDTIDTRMTVPKIKRQYRKLYQRDRSEVVKSLGPVAENIARAMIESSRVIPGVSNVLIFLGCGIGNTEAYISHALLKIDPNIRIDKIIMMDKTISSHLLALCDHWKTNLKISMITSDSFEDLTEKIKKIAESGVNIAVHAHNADTMFDSKRDIYGFEKFTKLMLELMETNQMSTTMLQSRTTWQYLTEATLVADPGDVMIINRTHFPGDIEGIAMLIWSTWPELSRNWLDSSEKKRNNMGQYRQHMTYTKFSAIVGHDPTC